jgi:hypothetical protein
LKGKSNGLTGGTTVAVRARRGAKADRVDDPEAPEAPEAVASGAVPVVRKAVAADRRVVSGASRGTGHEVPGRKCETGASRLRRW